MTLWLVPLLPMLAGIAIAAFGPQSRRALAAISGGVLAATLILAVLAVAGGWTGALDWGGGIALTARLVPLSALILVMVPAVALPVTVHAALHEAQRGLPRLVGLMLLFTGGMVLVVAAADLLTLLIGWELIGACSWALIGHDWRDRDNPASGLYAFVMTRFGDLGLFLAAMAAFGATGSFAYDALGGLQGPVLLIVAYGVLLSVASKAGQVPFSPWLFRAMAGPSSVSALLHAATLVAAGAYILARLHPVLSAATGWSVTVLSVGLATALAGGIVAVLQNHAKRLLAGSTSAQLGLMFVATGSGYPGVAALHLVAHAFYKAPLFLAAGLAGDRAGTYALDRLRLGRVMPLVAGAAAVAALALAAIPPLGGAWTKEEILKAAEAAGPWVAFGVVAAGAMSAAYATRFLLLAFGIGKADDESPAWPEIVGPLALSAVTLILSALWLGPVSGDLAALLGIALPEGSRFWLALSLLVVALGVASGVYLSRESPDLGTAGTAAAAADWLGLPTLVFRAVVQPFERLATSAASLDTRAVDGGIRATVTLMEWAARTSQRFGEAATDGLPEGTARLTSLAGRDLRRLQTGMSHHYYAYLVGGLALIIVFLALGA
ncbi:proton-conducting transporter membrane subunit [Paracoccus sp. (in: a-proteobacteria)]|nr:proton-conducting transporter membrane subunit [Paracoccus sp. (in: a-proteobacteria)]